LEFPYRVNYLGFHEDCQENFPFGLFLAFTVEGMENIPYRESLGQLFCLYRLSLGGGEIYVLIEVLKNFKFDCRCWMSSGVVGFENSADVFE